jgi:crotonobetainyl-CoA:carnitine CoA-transferase CaiB-like acyl-CoA transferase
VIDPLEGVQVVELCGDRAGSVAGMLLADLGASVTRVEAESGDLQRPSPLELADPVCWDRAKRRLVVEVLDPVGDPELAELLGRADIVLVDGGPDRVHGGHLDPERLAAASSRSVVTWLPPYGAHGGYGGLPADALLLSAVSGFATHQPAVTDVPIAPVVPVAENIQGGLAVAASLAALLERRTSGRGQVVTVSGLHAVAALEASVMSMGLDVEKVYRTGRDVRAAPHFRPYRCGDGRWLFLATLIPTLFLKALDVLDAFDVMLIEGVDGEFMNLLDPVRGRQASLVMEAKFATRPREAWLAALHEVGVPAAPVWDRSDWLASEAFAAFGGRRTFEHPVVGTVATPARPVELTDVAVAPGRAGGRADGWWPDRPRAAAADPDAAAGPLSGLRVLDLSTFLAGPFGPTMLADWGADVIKVETPTGDPYRTFTLAYLAVNHAKRSVVVDLHTEEGRDLLGRLVATADVMIDNVRPSARERLGVDLERLDRINPSLVHLNVTAFGIRGPYAERPGFDPVIQALSGLMVASGSDGQPVSTSTPVHDVSAATLVTIGVMAGLWHRAERGPGVRGITSLAAASSLLQCAELTDYAGRPPAATGGVDFLGDSAVHRYYETSDGWIAVAAGDESTARLVREVLGVEPGDRLRAVTVEEGVAVLRAAGIPAAPVLARDDWGADAHLVANDFAQVIADPVFGRCRVVGSFATFGRSGTAAPNGTLPVQGADTASVRRRLESGRAPWSDGPRS